MSDTELNEPITEGITMDPYSIAAAGASFVASVIRNNQEDQNWQDIKYKLNQISEQLNDIVDQINALPGVIQAIIREEHREIIRSTCFSSAGTFDSWASPFTEQHSMNTYELQEFERLATEQLNQIYFIKHYLGISGYPLMVFALSIYARMVNFIKSLQGSEIFHSHHVRLEALKNEIALWLFSFVDESNSNGFPAITAAFKATHAHNFTFLRDAPRKFAMGYLVVINYGSGGNKIRYKLVRFTRLSGTYLTEFKASFKYTEGKSKETPEPDCPLYPGIGNVKLQKNTDHSGYDIFHRIKNDLINRRNIMDECHRKSNDLDFHISTIKKIISELSDTTCMGN